jgi:glycosyltransferase involved in cell wall biosynthesis
MRIALLATKFWPVQAGLEFAVHYLAEEHASRGHDVVVFAPRYGGEYEELNSSYHLARFRYNPFPANLRGAGLIGLSHWMNRVQLSPVFKRWHTRTPFDVINVHSAYHPASLARELKSRFGVPTVVTCQGEDIQRIPEIGYGYRLVPRKDREICRNLEMTDRVAAISDSVRQEIERIVPPARVFDAPNGVDAERFSPGPSRFFKDRGLRGDDDFIVLSVGRNHKKKAFDIGLRALAHLREALPTVRYVHIGREGERLVDLARELGVEDRFHPLGEVDHRDLPDAYRDADVYLSPSIVEGFSLSNLEAMSAGIACVVSDGPGNRDAVRDGEAGLIVPVGDVPETAQAIKALHDSPERRKRSGNAARRSVLERYTWGVIAKSYQDAFAEILADSGKGPAPGVR